MSKRFSEIVAFQAFAGVSNVLNRPSVQGDIGPREGNGKEAKDCSVAVLRIKRKWSKARENVRAEIDGM
jgi:hypothetical protein